MIRFDIDDIDHSVSLITQRENVLISIKRDFPNTAKKKQSFTIAKISSREIQKIVNLRKKIVPHNNLGTRRISTMFHYKLLQK